MHVFWSASNIQSIHNVTKPGWKPERICPFDIAAVHLLEMPRAMTWSPQSEFFHLWRTRLSRPCGESPSSIRCEHAMWVITGLQWPIIHVAFLNSQEEILCIFLLSISLSLPLSLRSPLLDLINHPHEAQYLSKHLPNNLDRALSADVSEMEYYLKLWRLINGGQGPGALTDRF